MKLSVIVLSYNRARFVKQALHSLANQTCIDDIHCIVVDDNSNQETIDAITSFQYRFPKLTLLKTKPATEAERVESNRVAINVNSAISYLLHTNDDSQYLSYLCDDDVWFPKRCETMINFLDASPEVYLGYHYYTIWKCTPEGKKTEMFMNLCNPWSKQTKYYMLNTANCIDHCTFMHRRPYYFWYTDEAFRRCSDYGFLLGVLNQGGTFASMPEYFGAGRKIQNDSLNLDGHCNGRSTI